MLISVIIPVYNKEKYLQRCLDSLDKQEYKNLEIIIVDDGSTDRSFQICEDYKRKTVYPCKVLSQGNSGPSKARNRALEDVSGDYVVFLDADDALKSDCMSTINDIANEYIKCDIIEFDSVEEENDLHKEQQNDAMDANKRVYSNMEAVHELMNKGRIKTVVWGAAYKKSLLENIRFDEQIIWGEDACFKLDSCLAAEKGIVYVEKSLYINYMVDGTLSRQKVTDSVIKSVLAMLEHYRTKLMVAGYEEREFNRYAYNVSRAYYASIIVNKYDVAENLKVQLFNNCKRYHRDADLSDVIKYLMCKYTPGLYKLLLKNKK